MKRNRSERRLDAIERVKAYTFNNSKRKRLGSEDESAWEKDRVAFLKHLESIRF
jgi:hypothetical protein